MISVTATLVAAVPVGFLTPVGTSLHTALFGDSPGSARRTPQGGASASGTPSSVGPAEGADGTAPTTAPPADPRFALQTGPGCPDVSNASTSPYSFSPAHQWLPGGTSGCLSAYLYTPPTTAGDPSQWQNDLDWWFSGVPKTMACTIGIYIPPISRATGTALYFWTTGSPDYSPSTEFTVDQAANRGRWVTIGPFRFPAGRAHVEITDTREAGSDVTLVASAVRLLC